MKKTLCLLVCAFALAIGNTHAAESSADRDVRCLKEAQALGKDPTGYLMACRAGKTAPMDSKVVGKVLAPGEVPSSSDLPGVKDKYCKDQVKAQGIKTRAQGRFLGDCMKKLG